MNVQLERPGAAQSDLLIHFCGRGGSARQTPHVTPDILGLSPSERLDHILQEEQFRAFPPFGAPRRNPMVCFSESPLPHLIHLIRDRGWQPWGVVVRREWVYSLGGGPVWYARQEQFKQLTDTQKAWAVRFEVSAETRSDWTHEREWRVPVDPDYPFLDFSPSDIVAILIGDPSWEPTKVTNIYKTGHPINAITGEPCSPDNPYTIDEYPVDELPLSWQSAEIWIWDRDSEQIKRPDGSPLLEINYFS